MVLLSEKQQRDLLILAGLSDLLVGGKITGLTKRALVGVLKPAAKFVGRAALRQPVAMAGTARIIAMRHPVATGLAVAYVAYTEREKIQALLEQGYEIIEERFPEPSMPSPGIPGVEEIITSTGGMAYRPPRPSIGRGLPEFSPSTFLRKPKRKPSAFNRAVSAGMKAIKKSTSYGGKGKIKPAKKAFSVVVKLAAAKKKKKKAPKSGIRRRIWNAMKGLR